MTKNTETIRLRVPKTWIEKMNKNFGLLPSLKGRTGGISNFVRKLIAREIGEEVIDLHQEQSKLRVKSKPKERFVDYKEDMGDWVKFGFTDTHTGTNYGARLEKSNGNEMYRGVHGARDMTKEQILEGKL